MSGVSVEKFKHLGSFALLHNVLLGHRLLHRMVYEN